LVPLAVPCVLSAPRPQNMADSAPAQMTPAPTHIASNTHNDKEKPVNAASATAFELKDEQIQRLRRLTVGWAGVEAGAPGVDYAESFGMDPLDENPAPAFLKWLGVKPQAPGGQYTPEQQNDALSVFMDLGKAFEILLSAGELKPGHYSFK